MCRKGSAVEPVVFGLPQGGFSCPFGERSADRYRRILNRLNEVLTSSDDDFDEF